MTPKRKVWLVVFCIIVVGLIVIAIEIKNDNAATYAKSLNETPYLITKYENGVYLIEINPAQYRYEREYLLASGLSEIKGKCTITSFAPLNTAEHPIGILVTTSGTCEIATTPY